MSRLKHNSGAESKFVYLINDRTLCVSAYNLEERIHEILRVAGYRGSHVNNLTGFRHDNDCLNGPATGGEMIFHRGVLISFNDQSGFISGCNFAQFLPLFLQPIGNWYTIERRVRDPKLEVKGSVVDFFATKRALAKLHS